MPTTTTAPLVTAGTFLAVGSGTAGEALLTITLGVYERAVKIDGRLVGSAGSLVQIRALGRIIQESESEVDQGLLLLMSDSSNLALVVGGHNDLQLTAPTGSETWLGSLRLEFCPL